MGALMGEEVGRVGVAIGNEVGVVGDTEGGDGEGRLVGVGTVVYSTRGPAWLKSATYSTGPCTFPPQLIAVGRPKLASAAGPSFTSPVPPLTL